VNKTTQGGTGKAVTYVWSLLRTVREMRCSAGRPLHVGTLVEPEKSDCSVSEHIMTFIVKTQLNTTGPEILMWTKLNRQAIQRVPQSYSSSRKKIV